MPLDEDELKKEIKRKILQLNVSLRENVTYDGPDYFQDFVFHQNNLSPISPDEVELATNFLGQELDYPIMFAPLVGGYKDSNTINAIIAESAETYNIAMGIGNQLYGLVLESMAESYSIAREKGPNVCILGNLWAKNLIKMKEPIEAIQKCIDMIEADLFELTLSPLTEQFYYKEESRGAHLIDLLPEICEKIKVPIIVRGLESGLCHEEVRQLWDQGVDGIDSQGMGGTDLVKIESLRHMSLAEKQSPYVPKVFDYWGIHTMWSLMDIKLRSENKDIPLILGGGIRNGLQATICLALGADIISVGYPILIQAVEDIGYPNEKNLDLFMQRFTYEIKMVMSAVGAKNVKELREICKTRLFIKGDSKAWMKHRRLSFP